MIVFDAHSLRLCPLSSVSQRLVCVGFILQKLPRLTREKIMIFVGFGLHKGLVPATQVQTKKYQFVLASISNLPGKCAGINIQLFTAVYVGFILLHL